MLIISMGSDVVSIIRTLMTFVSSFGETSLKPHLDTFKHFASGLLIATPSQSCPIKKRNWYHQHVKTCILEILRFD